MKDGRGVLRIEGKRYPVTLVRSNDAQRRAVGLLAIEKYELGAPEGLDDPDAFWAFRVEPREREES